VVAHRGASGEYPENTLLAFAKGLEQGADAVELDVRASADGVPVVMHDATLERTTSGAGPVAHRTVAELGRVDAGAGEAVPTMAQVLERFPATPLLIEIKEARVAGPLLAVLRTHGAERRVVVASFEAPALAPFKGSGIARAATRVEVAACWLWSRVGLGMRGPGYGLVSVPERSGRLRVVDGGFVARARRARIPVHVWTVNDRAVAERLRRLGVNGVITDYPARMREPHPLAPSPRCGAGERDR
jgi:glycerophosphoryl diester phosphodiesterase